MYIKKLFNTVVLFATLFLLKWFIVNHLGYGWAGYGKFTYYFAAVCYAIASIFWLIAALVDAL
jgi:hypothetical protein